MDIRLVIGGTFGILALAWVLTSKNTPTILTAIGTAFADIVKPLTPPS